LRIPGRRRGFVVEAFEKFVDHGVHTDGNLTRVYSKRGRESGTGDIYCSVAPS
jgi:hypothetical protein